ncbi:hypothetical protein J4H86_09235 [Spiractinospora alimapuensis]|uniref:hypothetical protein n=1 Tax=Spiractinospora alimapuensis TaxID=2820884 RepID=UPI001F18D23C|nr:hypothetical protein [Spiractinospora alimapuensis]QVQ53870.1 hypothetical protein J4H86_09235 [Spiractinospora alimapuensis]
MKGDAVLLGVNPQSADQRGAEAERLSDTFTDLACDFATLVCQTEDAAAEPLCQAGYPDFLDIARSRMCEVQEHGSALGGNVRGAASISGETDSDSAEDFAGVRAEIAARIEGSTYAYTTVGDAAQRAGYAETPETP